MTNPYTAAVAIVMLLFVGSTSAVRFNESSWYQTCVAAPASCRSLSLQSSSLSGTLPSELGTLTSLTNMRLAINQLSGTLPSELGALTRLTFMGLWNNQLTGTLPLELAALASLTTMWLDRNQLTGTLPSELGTLASLAYMHFFQNQLTGTLPSELGALTRLTSIAFSDNQLTGTLPTELGALSRLTNMWVCDNSGLCGDIPAGVTPTTTTSYGCPTALGGTLLGSHCPTSPPTTESTYTPTSVPGDQPLKDNWFRKRDVARKEAFPQKHSWFRKQAKLEAGMKSTK
eukprot:CAMPEP_0114296100 /NCGR_PEP_ID=MMETSP0059-20121206/11134_1 /TAXON_ID=36894 /ORGANISM="Pyramimonas parkeae, Strain CCMP726" /LENGTH=286 /DNA_ID=CAMNT_0001418231 /DNA_START=138 /DNA_END=998 /DNA_ORIENTATION=-